jgi:hypothetical protein
VKAPRAKPVTPALPTPEPEAQALDVEEGLGFAVEGVVHSILVSDRSS